MALTHPKEVKYMLLHHLDKIRDHLIEVDDNYLVKIDEEPYHCGSQMVMSLEPTPHLFRVKIEVTYEEWKP